MLGSRVGLLAGASSAAWAQWAVLQQAVSTTPEICSHVLPTTDKLYCVNAGSYANQSCNQHMNGCS
jgi:hypothetical protein